MLYTYNLDSMIGNTMRDYSDYTLLQNLTSESMELEDATIVGVCIKFRHRSYPYDRDVWVYGTLELFCYNDKTESELQKHTTITIRDRNNVSRTYNEDMYMTSRYPTKIKFDDSGLCTIVEAKVYAIKKERYMLDNFGNKRDIIVDSGANVIPTYFSTIGRDASTVVLGVNATADYSNHLKGEHIFIAMNSGFLTLRPQLVFDSNAILSTNELLDAINKEYTVYRSPMKRSKLNIDTDWASQYTEVIKFVKEVTIPVNLGDYILFNVYKNSSKPKSLDNFDNIVDVKLYKELIGEY